MRHAALSVVVLAAALLVQLTFVNRLALPGGGAPDLVLLAVVALTFQATPTQGAVTGFAAGLALDLAPPGSYLTGEYALIFCLVGYLCARLRGVVGGSAAAAIASAMAVVAAGEAAGALLGRVVSDPQVTWAAVRYLLPSSLVYDVVLVPFALYGAMRALRWAEGVGQVPEGVLAAHAQAAGPALPAVAAPGGAGLLGGAGWLAGPVSSGGVRRQRAARRAATRQPRTPNLRAAASRPGDGWVGGGSRAGLSRLPRPRPAPSARLRPGALRGSSSRAGTAYPGRPSAAGARGAGARLAGSSSRGSSARLRGSSFRRGSARLGGSSPAGAAGWAAAGRPPAARSRGPNLRLGTRRHRDGTFGRPLGTAGGPAARVGPGIPGSAFRAHAPTVTARGIRGVRGGRGVSGGRGVRGVRREHGFRPDRRLLGGSASGARPAGALLPARQVRLRMRARMRRDGVLGGSVLAGTGRPASLRLGSPRRRDGMLGGLAPHRKRWAGRQAAPRFRSGPSLGSRLVTAVRAPFRRKRRLRLRPGSRSLAGWRMSTYRGGLR